RYTSPTLYISLPAASVFLTDTATTTLYTPSLHDALPISASTNPRMPMASPGCTTGCETSSAAKPTGNSCGTAVSSGSSTARWRRSEEHTSELQSRENLVCRLLLEKKKKLKKRAQQLKRAT